jgi:hypothetical protein
LPQISAQTFIQRIKNWGVLQHPLKALPCWIRFLPTNQKVNAADLWKVHQRVCQPHFADETCYANQHDVFTVKSAAHGKRLAATFLPQRVVKVNDGTLQLRNLPNRGKDRRSKRVGVGQSKVFC